MERSAIRVRLKHGIVIAVAVAACWRTVALADPTPAPVHAGWSDTLDGFASLVDQATDGSGTQPPEGSAFAGGAPLAPLTPYDTFASTPQTPGVAGLLQFTLTTRYAARRLDASLVSGFGAAAGSTTNNAYWTESLMPTLNPHLGSVALPYAVGFPSGAGHDDGSSVRGSILGAAVGASDGAWRLRGGWFDLTQDDRFVFAPPPLTNLTPALVAQTAESLGDGSPTLDGWPAPASGLPLHGVDLTAHERSSTLELTDAALTSLPGTSARLTLASVVMDRGNSTRLSADFLHLATSGDPIATSTLFGRAAHLDPGPQGDLPSSTLGGQRQTIAGLRGQFHVGDGFVALIEAARSWYDADQVLLPGTQSPGGFYHVALSHAARRATTSIEAFRFEPNYATAILPYGAPENVWSVAWSWPGPWLKSTYQLVDNSITGVNRQGYRLRYDFGAGPIKIRAAYGSFVQIDAATYDVVNRSGFVDGFFLPQTPGDGTIGRMHQYATWIAWHTGAADLGLDYVADTMHRDFFAGRPQDAVTLDVPQVVASATRRLSDAALVSIGYGRFATRGSWSQGNLSNVDFVQQLGFAAAQLRENAHAQVLVQLRHGSFQGLPSIPSGPSPEFHATTLVVEQRFHI